MTETDTRDMHTALLEWVKAVAAKLEPLNTIDQRG